MKNHYEEYIPQNLSVYQYFQKNAENYLNNTAISFYGKNFSYGETLTNINEIVRALRAYGIKKDDVVASSLPGTPEGIFLIYAINKIGAIYCAFDCRAKKEEIKETVSVFSPKLCFIPDFQVKEFADITDCNIVYINPAHSIGSFSKFFSCVADLFTGRNFLVSKKKNLISYDSFINAVIDGEDITAQTSTNNIFGYFYTSGTTHGRKSIILTNENINAAVIQHKNANKNLKAGDSILNIMPLFTCYSVTIAVHLPLITGIRVNLIPLVNTKKLKNILLKEKPNYFISVPAHWEYFIKSDFKGCDLSFLKTAIVGGDTMTEKEQKVINDIFKKCNCNNPIVIGYGLSESTSTATTTVLSSPIGSVGMPLINTLIGIFETDTDKKVSVGHKGEICICSPSVCKGYYKEEALNEKLLKIHSDGKTWLHTGDIGYVDESGALFFCERIKRMYVRFDGTKVSPYSIEQAIIKCPLVSKCLVVGIKDSEHSHGKCARAYIELKNNVNKKTAKEQLYKYFNKHLDEHMVPKELILVERLPHTVNGKLDYFVDLDK